MAAGSPPPIAIAPEEVGVSERADGAIEIAFSLPAGAYATAVLREFVATE